MKIIRALYAFIKIPFLLVVTSFIWLFFSKHDDKSSEDDPADENF